jgi:hypothetical protein
MATTRLFQQDGSQAVPKAKPPLKTLAEVARYMRENFPEGQDFPDREQPRSPQDHG